MELATKLSQIQQDDTPIMVPFFITQLRTQKKNVYGVQGPGSFYCDLSHGLHDRREAGERLRKRQTDVGSPGCCASSDAGSSS